MTVLLKLPEVKRRTSLCRSEIYRLMQIGAFPKNIKTSIRSSAWIDREIEEWIQQAISRSRPEEQTNHSLV